MILLHLFTGVISTSLLFLVILFARSRNKKFTALNWFFIIAEIIYLAFIIELVAGFIEEGAPQAALVIGSIFGSVAVIGAVLVLRFIILKKISHRNYETE
ncbi:MAG: hypothetical protein RQ743_10455 [Bacteroidales bacterium]|nr:hypothetical protein [Bacteroidales bacterium]